MRAVSVVAAGTAVAEAAELFLPLRSVDCGYSTNDVSSFLALDATLFEKMVSAECRASIR